MAEDYWPRINVTYIKDGVCRRATDAFTGHTTAVITYMEWPAGHIDKVKKRLANESEWKSWIHHAQAFK